MLRISFFKKEKDKQRSMRLIAVILVFLSGFPSSLLHAQGNLLITPRRVVFEGNKRSQELNLANTGKDTATYVISFVQIRMKEDGTFENITQPDSGQYFADKYLRFFPRSVKLGPNEVQTVKVQLLRSPDLVEGEYRSHIYFRAIPDDKPLGEKSPGSDSGVSVRLKPVFGISIPAIIRVGAIDGAVALKHLQVKVQNDTIPYVEMTMERSGKTSVYGDLTIDHISSYGKITRVATVNGVAIYTPTPSRILRAAINKYAGADLSGGTLRIQYSDQSSRKNILAQQDIPVSLL